MKHSIFQVCIKHILYPKRNLLDAKGEKRISIVEHPHARIYLDYLLFDISFKDKQDPVSGFKNSTASVRNRPGHR